MYVKYMGILIYWYQIPCNKWNCIFLNPYGRVWFIKKYLSKLIAVNNRLWKIEDKLREHERQKKFDQKFIHLARSVYITNDERSKVKLEINRKFGSTIIEIKSYKKY